MRFAYRTSKSFHRWCHREIFTLVFLFENTPGVFMWFASLHLLLYSFLICLYTYLCNRWYSCLVALLNHVHLALIDRLTLIDLVII